MTIFFSATTKKKEINKKVEKREMDLLILLEDKFEKVLVEFIHIGIYYKE